jgi:ribonuclease G
MSKSLIINTNASETRIALLEKGRVAELAMERHRERGMVGNIYKGIVTRVLPGMQSAFIDIGLDRSAFLYGGDVCDPDDVAAVHDTDDPDEARRRQVKKPIEKLLHAGQKIIVQVAKEPLGSKGARVTMYLSLPGRYTVLMPSFNHIGVSRRIEDEAERDRLKALVESCRPEGYGLIVRTAAAQTDDEQIKKDITYLHKIWGHVELKRQNTGTPALIYKEPDLIIKTTRDMYSDDIEKIIVDEPGAHETLKAFLGATIPKAKKKLELYQGMEPIFDHFGIEMDIARALSNKVWLPSGGYLVIDQTEALTSFDVNTGKFVGQLAVQDTILKTNLEAVHEIVAQLRVRNIGGIIVLDFIDMERGEDRDTVYNTLQEELKRDKAKTNVLKISELGLVQMTRKRTSDSLERRLTEPCPYCDGRGRILSTCTEALDLLRDIERHHLRTKSTAIKVKVRRDIRDWIQSAEHELLNSLVAKYNLQIEFIEADLTIAALNEAAYEVQ